MKIPSTEAMSPPLSQPHHALTGVLKLIATPMQSLEDLLTQQRSYFEFNVGDYIDYACGSSGKRLRPMLAMLAGGATGHISSEHINLGLIVELIHIASLVHDDIMDGAHVRRERPTLNAKWGNGITVLVGDILFAHALRLATDFSNKEISRRIADAAIGVCSGEMLQTQRCFDPSLTLENYYRIIEMKTGSLFAVACELGGLLNGCSDEVMAALKQYGNHIGIAYQILDDCIDLLGDEATFGKTLGTDLSGGKFTLPILMFFKTTAQGDQAILHHALLNDKTMNRQTLVKILLEQGSFRATMAKFNHLLDQAEGTLALLSHNDFVQGLGNMVVYLRELASTKISVFLDSQKHFKA